MIDFSSLRAKQTTIARMAAEMTPELLREATRSVYDYLLELLCDCCDPDVVFEPLDPKAIDPYTQDPAQLSIAWTLAHVIVHFNASLEESAFLAAELARGVDFHGRSRYEIAWQEVDSIDRCRDLLMKSRDMCITSLDLWPDPPHYETTYSPWTGAGVIDARGRYLLGLKHIDDHIEQIKDIVQQAKKGVFAAQPEPGIS